MKFLTSLLLLATSTIAVPVASTAKHFHLKSSGATIAAHNNLYVYAYHTGAGLNDAVLTKDASIASPIYLNGTNALFDLQTDFPWGMIATGNTNYASWSPIVINAGDGGTDGFSVKGNNFQWSEANGFGGWLVCDWIHNAPQLFYLNRYYDAIIPSSCSKVQLKTEYIK
ncbi:uncharacterized protein N7479_006015 [Penicillium vulpinum]|uniref:DUF7907 domain-containing protein n=1 Tax=Penicillium vulpinum TaxID=29845 RepID=A0A1V6SE98_9EURO|nr:uncharacterized protein N7479_006015 [Penicillium vulpinum]KAJ5958865.1 hypothetical protein N7479_006015 [Penicillium vulpinum]OQE12238.1 hypothetical protein PENVUL_c001G09832 [Penicillium vulpinum]